jgi:hypothetical protein
VLIVQLSAAGPSEVGAHCAVTSSRSSPTASCLPRASTRRSFDASSRNQLHDPLQGPGAPDALVTAHCAVVIGELRSVRSFASHRASRRACGRSPELQLSTLRGPLSTHGDSYDATHFLQDRHIVRHHLCLTSTLRTSYTRRTCFTSWRTVAPSALPQLWVRYRDPVMLPSGLEHLCGLHSNLASSMVFPEQFPTRAPRCNLMM